MDNDDVGDFCEEQLAYAFRPELAYWHGDLIGGEPYWAAELMAGDTIRIAYLLAYYVDDGVEHPLCPSWPDVCSGHYGDSEWITVDVTFNPAENSRHWIARRVQLSQHGDVATYGPSYKGYPLGFVYPQNPGGYFRSYVAISKHANYRSQSECDAGGFWGFDSCSPDTFARIRAGSVHNIGSRSAPMRDCVASSNPFYPGTIECFWTGARFAGWQGAIPDARSYDGILSTLGF